MKATGARIAWWTVNVVLILGIAAATAVGLWLNGRDITPSRPTSQTESTERVQQHVEKVVPKLLSYTPESVAGLAETVDPLLTGDFKDEYRELLETAVVPQAQQQRITTDAEVVGVAVESLSADVAELLVFIDQESSTVADPQPDADESAVQMVLRKVQGQWLISSFKPV